MPTPRLPLDNQISDNKVSRPVKSDRGYTMSPIDRNNMLYSTAISGIPASVAASLIVAWIAGISSNPIMASAWLVLMWSVLAARTWNRFLFYRESSNARADRAEHWYRRMVFTMSSMAFIWSLAMPLFYRAMDGTDRTILIAALCASASGLAMFLTAAPRLAKGVTICVFLPCTIMLSMGVSHEPALALCTVAFVGAVMEITSRNYEQLARALELSRSNSKLMDDAVRQRHQVQELNNELSLAQRSLTAMNAKLEDKVRRRTRMLEAEIRARETYQQKLELLANEDPLTGLANRSQLSRTLANAIAQAVREKSRLAVLFIDLDRFKAINDGLGHPTGDKVLKVVATRLSDSTPEALCVARWGGDEFVVVIQVPELSRNELTESADRIIDQLSQCMAIDTNRLQVGASVGISIFPDHAKDSENLIKQADMAVYQAKDGGRGKSQVFRPEWQVEASERHRLVQDLKLALQNEQLDMSYQPVVDPASGRVTTMEALLRWQHPTRGAIAPSTFVALAEENGLMVELGAWVLDRSCQHAKRLVGENCDRVSINVSVHQFAHGDFVTMLDDAMRKYDLDPSRLELELTETIYARDPSQMLSTVQAIRRRGVRIIVDDFGTGYSSLAYFQRFPVDVLKVDRSIVRDLERGGDTIVAAITSLARSLNVQVVAEGVETVSQLRKIRKLGVHLVQGYLFAKPMNIDQAEAWLKNPEHAFASDLLHESIAQ